VASQIPPIILTHVHIGNEMNNQINTIKKEKSKNGKIQILIKNDSILLRKVLNYAYDPYKVYHIAKASLKKLGKVVPSGISSFGPFFECLDEQGKLTGCTGERLTELAAILEDMSIDTFNVAMMILGKDLRAGISAKSINKAFPGLIPEFSVQLCKLMDLDNLSGEYLCSYKLDGLRCLAIPVNGSYSLFSRNGKMLDFPELSTYLTEKYAESDLIFDGEVFGESWEDSMSIMRKDKIDTNKLKYHVFDTIRGCEWREEVSVSEYEIAEVRYKTTLDILAGSDSVVRIVKQIKCDGEGITEVYTKALDRGHEGLVLKLPKSTYDKKRGWAKFKPSDNIDLPIVDIIEGEGRFIDMLGAFVVDNAGVDVNVGSGLSDEQRTEYWNSREELIGTVIEVKYDSMTPGGSLRFPRFIGLRPDKN
jgi:DNA ligase-1